MGPIELSVPDQGCRCRCLRGVPGEECARMADGEDMLCTPCRTDEECQQAREELRRRVAWQAEAYKWHPRVL